MNVVRFAIAGGAAASLASAVLLAVPAAQVRDTSAEAPESIQTVEKFDELEPRTAVEKRLAEYYDDSDSPYNLEQMWNSGWNAQGIVMTNFGGVVQDVAPPAEPSESEIIKSRICTAEVIVFGRAASRRTLLNKSLSWLFTNYSITVDEWVYPAAGATSLQASSSNGEALVNGKFGRTNGRAALPIVRLQEDSVFFVGHLNQSRTGSIEGFEFRAIVPQPGVNLEGGERLAARAAFVRQVREVKPAC